MAALVGAGALLAAGAVRGPHDLVLTGIPIAGGLIAVSAVLLMPILTRRSARRGGASWFADRVDGIDSARHALLSSSWRLIGAVGYLALDIAALGASFAATGHPVPVAPLVLGYLIGYLANLIPVPGGFGVLEGGPAGTLIAYGAPVTQATAAVIVYHAIAFWIPSLGGVAGYWLLQRRQPRAAAAIAEAPRSAGAPAPRSPAGQGTSPARARRPSHVKRATLYRRPPITSRTPPRSIPSTTGRRTRPEIGSRPSGAERSANDSTATRSRKKANASSRAPPQTPPATTFASPRLSDTGDTPGAGICVTKAAAVSPRSANDPARQMLPSARTTRHDWLVSSHPLCPAAAHAPFCWHCEIRGHEQALRQSRPRRLRSNGPGARGPQSRLDRPGRTVLLCRRPCGSLHQTAACRAEPIAAPA